MRIYRRDLNIMSSFLYTLCSERMTILRWLYVAKFYFKIPELIKQKGAFLWNSSLSLWLKLRLSKPSKRK
jgi:hypothetical protein